MSRGMRKGSKELMQTGRETARTMSILTQKGEMTPEGAMRLEKTMRSSMTKSGMDIQSPEDVQRFMMFHEAGDGFDSHDLKSDEEVIDPPGINP